MYILKFINYAISLLYPNTCGICENICKNEICKKCNIRLNNIAKIKVDVYNNKNFRKHLYIFKYEGIIKERILKFKFNQRSYIYKAFVKFMLKNKKICGFLKNYDIIIPVPIHKSRKLKRGYNQSALIAKDIAQYFNNIDYSGNILLKKINNKPQSTKNKEDREKNVIGAYYIKKSNRINNRRVLLLDDIYTTGSTANECAKVLIEAGAKIIGVLTIAKD